MNRSRSYSLPAYEMPSLQAYDDSDISDPLLTLWASISRPPSHPSALRFPTIHDEISSNQLWDFDALCSYPTPLDKTADDFLIPSKTISQMIPISDDLTESASLFESLIATKEEGSSQNLEQDKFIPNGRHRSFSMSCTTARRFTGVEKTIQCPFCDKMFYKKYTLKSHLVSHSSNFKLTKI